jgi:hypothetical protein
MSCQLVVEVVLVMDGAEVRVSLADQVQVVVD